MRVKIREARQEDFEIIWKVSIETVWNDVPEDEKGRLDRKIFEEGFKTGAQPIILDPRNTALVAENYSGDFAGYIIFGPVDRTMLSPFGFGFVYDIYVAPGLRGRGVGRRLMREAEERCRRLGLRKLKLEVGSNNRDALMFYERIGFKAERMFMGKALS